MAVCCATVPELSRTDHARLWRACPRQTFDALSVLVHEAKVVLGVGKVALRWRIPSV